MDRWSTRRARNAMQVIPMISDPNWQPDLSAEEAEAILARSEREMDALFEWDRERIEERWCR